MPRGRRRTSDGAKDQTTAGSAQPGHNGFDALTTTRFVQRIESLLGDIDSERGRFMRKAKSLREDVRSVFDEATNAGIPRRELRTAIKARALGYKIEKLREDMDEDRRETYDQIRQALGDLADTPLGQAAATRTANTRAAL